MGRDAVLNSSAARLWKLIDERIKVGADTTAIDQRIWDLFGEEWSIMFTDLAGFSRQVAKFGIIHFLQVIHEQKQLLLPIVEKHDGVLIKIEADSFLILFKKPTGAIACAIEMQRVCQATNKRRSPEEHIVLCVGLGHGRLLKVGDEDVYGHEVNLASKLGEDTAEGNEILATNAVRAATPELTWEEVAADYAGETTCWRMRY
ncbi:MAG: adenylate/guanylate cyclase domain-containing protein [Myxococcales bacterium]|nr:adenylate/guanylate cyclase domain-containing protein [Myxococcales bacterium]